MEAHHDKGRGRGTAATVMLVTAAALRVLGGECRRSRRQGQGGEGLLVDGKEGGAGPVGFCLLYVFRGEVFDGPFEECGGLEIIMSYRRTW